MTARHERLAYILKRCGRFKKKIIKPNMKRRRRANKKKITTMEAIRSKVHAAVTASVGTCSVDISRNDPCLVIRLERFPRLPIFVQQDR